MSYIPLPTQLMRAKCGSFTKGFNSENVIHSVANQMSFAFLLFLMALSIRRVMSVFEKMCVLVFDNN